MFSWVCPRCGHDVPPSKTECPFCFPPVPEGTQEQAEAEVAPQQPVDAPQYPPQAPPQYAPPQYGQQAPPQYGQQAPPQYWPPQGQPPQYPPPSWPQQGPPQNWPPPQQPQYPPQGYQYPPQPPYQPPPPPKKEAPPAYQPPPPPPVQYAPSQAAPVTEYRQPDRTATPWPPAEERTGKPAWMIAVLAFAGVLAVFGVAYFLMGSHGSSSSAKDAAKQQTTNPLQKYIEVVGIRLVTVKGVQSVKFLAVNHSGVELTDLNANVTLYASTQRSEEDSVGSFTFKTDSIGPNESKEMTAPLKTDKRASDMPDDWRNISADVQIQGPQ